MADVLKMLVTTNANRNPPVTTETVVYTVPPATTAMVSHILVCNRSAAPGTFRISLVPSGGIVGNANYIAFDAPIGANDTVHVPINGGLNTGDFISVYDNNSAMTFTPFGIEVTA